MASSTSVGGQSYVKVEINSLDSPAEPVAILTTSFRPAFEAQRKMRVSAVVGGKSFEVLVEFRDEVFEPTTIQGASKYKDEERK